MSTDERPLVLHVIHHLVIGGMENGLVNLINHSSEAEYRHAIACIEDYSEFRSRIVRKDVEIVALHRSRIGSARLAWRLFRLCRQLRPTVVHSRNLSGLDALFPARLAGVPHCVHGEHGWDVDNLYGGAWRPALLRRLHSPLVSHYITVSKNLRRFLVERLRIPAARISQIYNGVDTDRFRPSPSPSREWLPSSFRVGSVVLIGTVGRLQPVKDHATLLRAFSLLLAERPDLRPRLRLTVVGDGPLMNELRGLAESLRIAEATFFPGALENIADALRTIDVFALPSLNEGISNTILEAMATGVPVVASAVGGNPELVADGTSGRLFPAGDEVALSQLLGNYATDRSLCQAHGAAARRIAVDRYSLRLMVARYEDIYARFCRGGWGRQQAGQAAGPPPVD